MAKETYYFGKFKVNGEFFYFVGEYKNKKTSGKVIKSYGALINYVNSIFKEENKDFEFINWNRKSNQMFAECLNLYGFNICSLDGEETEHLEDRVKGLNFKK